MKKQIQHLNIKKPTKYQPKTLKLIGLVRKLITKYKGRKLTLRQIFYQLVAKRIIPNNLRAYKNLSYLIAKARKNEDLPWDVMRNHTRFIIKENSWPNYKDFTKKIEKIYRKSKLANQRNYIEIWIEKDSLREWFEPITKEFDIPLIICRGYPSITTLYEASKRLKEIQKPIHILYFGDFDPSGEDIFRAIKERLIKDFKINPKKLHIKKVALTLKDVKQYKLPPAPTKATDSRSRKFIKKFGNFAVELEALPVRVLEQKIKRSIKSLLNWKQFQKDLKKEKQEAKKLRKLAEKIEKA
jgi:5S rRNA maturation endonuclease (ribonuclease M5)